MRAINLLPPESQHRGGISLGQLGPVHVVIGVLVVVLAYVTVYVLTNNSISERKAQLASLQTQLTQEQAQIARLNSYTQFAKLAQQRAETVRQIAASRFDWHGALTDLSKVMPANASLQSLRATVAPSVSVSGSGGSASGGGASASLRGAINAPAFEVSGCAASQDDVARLISRLRLINDVQRVTLEDSAKPVSAAGSASSGAGGGACSANAPTFDLVVFFHPLPGASAAATSAPSGAPVSTPAGGAARASQASTPSSSTGAGR